MPTAAPVVGETSGRFETRLDERNLTRLPAVTADAGAVEGFWLGAASTAGLSHAHAARTGQDSYSWAVSEDASAIVVAVADGLGSRAKTSQVGATLLVRSVCSALATLASSDFDGDDGAEAARRCIDEASVQAFERARTFLPDVEEADLASTLAFGWIPFDPQARRALFGRVGDCGAFRLSGGEFETIFEPDDHPLNVVGGWLPVKEVGELLDVREVEGPVGTVILATDGLVEDIFGSPSVRSWLADRWGPRCSAFRMIDSLRFRRQGSHDDRTALVVWTSNESGDGEPDPAADGEEGPS